MRIMDNDPSNFEPTPTIHDRPHYSDAIISPGHSRRKILAVAGIVFIVLLLAGGGAAYWFLSRPKATPANTTSQGTTVPNQPLVPDDTQAQGTNRQYVSNGKDLNLSFSYPSNWTVTPPTNNNTTDQPITVTSPLVSIPGTSGQSTTGKVVVSIRPGGSTLSELSSSKATAGQASAQIAYDKPTSAQHQYPYLTYLHLAGGANPNSSFEEVIITGISSFTKDQVLVPADLSLLDPIVSARFYACSDQACTTGSATPLSITNNTWQNAQVCMQTLAIFQSLQIN